MQCGIEVSAVEVNWIFEYFHESSLLKLFKNLYLKFFPLNFKKKKFSVEF
jgi:hypothetical protein